MVRIIPVGLISLFLGFCLMGGWGMAKALEYSSFSSSSSYMIAQNNYEIGKKVYIEKCSGCHIPIAPEVFPSETWLEILKKPEDHYGQPRPPILSFNKQLIWQYIQRFSRPLAASDITPFYFAQSRYFKALHPKVELPENLTHQTCINCHPGANQLEYRQLTPEWENSP